MSHSSVVHLHLFLFKLMLILNEALLKSLLCLWTANMRGCEFWSITRTPAAVKSSINLRKWVLLTQVFTFRLSLLASLWGSGFETCVWQRGLEEVIRLIISSLKCLFVCVNLVGFTRGGQKSGSEVRGQCWSVSKPHLERSCSASMGHALLHPELKTTCCCCHRLLVSNVRMIKKTAN